MSIRSLSSLAIVAGLALSGPIASAAPSPDVATQVATVTTPAVTSPADDAATYANREAKTDKKVANFAGGSVIVIGLSSAAAVVVIVLLLLLLL